METKKFWKNKQYIPRLFLSIPKETRFCFVFMIVWFDLNIE